jgi:hypothetical protein
VDVHLEVTFLCLNRQSFNEGADFITNWFFYLRVVGTSEHQCGPLQRDSPKGKTPSLHPLVSHHEQLMRDIIDYKRKDAISSLIASYTKNFTGSLSEE